MSAGGPNQPPFTIPCLGKSTYNLTTPFDLFGDPIPKAPSSRDWEEEYIACKHWDRVPRTDLKKTPFYPWMPPTRPYKVSFALKFQ